ncbi:MAG: FAD-binding protein, partial [Holophaga sp.]|nr:FAD-binding protein [Holophaga sp.]
MNEAKIITSDVLVVGHGLAGLAAALTVKEDNPGLHVVTVDKCFPGYGGKANKGGGHVAFIPEGDEETYVQYHTENLGDYLNDQDMLRIYANSTQKTMDRWETWGVKFKLSREDSLNAHAIIPWKVTLVDLDVMIPMARRAAKLGIKSHSKVAMTDLLTEGGRVVGAFGISLLTGEPCVFKAKAVILACGDQNWSIMNMWNGKGDGIAAAYRAGAKVRNAEFGTFVNLMDRASKTVAYGAEDALVNAKGKACTMESRADLPPSMKSVVGGIDLGGGQSVLMYLEVRDGNGPIYEDLEKNDFIGSWIGRNLCCYGGDADEEYYRPLAQKFWNVIFNKNRMGAPVGEGATRREVVPGVVGECSPLYVDHGMATT